MSGHLDSWNEGAVKRAIVEFVTRVTSPDRPAFVPPADRIEVFDNDGTLRCEQPVIQLAHVLQLWEEMAQQNTALSDRPVTKNGEHPVIPVDARAAAVRAVKEG